MSATTDDADADLERRLTASLHEHAAKIVTTPTYALADRMVARAPHRRVTRYRLVSAALAVAIAAVGLVVHVDHDSTSRTAGPQECVRSVPNNFAALLAANQIPGATGTVVSGASDGSLLLAGPDNRSLVLVDPNGRPTRIWTATGDQVATIDPQAAISDYAVVFAVGPAHSNPTTIEVYRRDEVRLETLATTEPSNPLLAVAPINMDDNGYWVTGSASETEKIAYFELQDETSTPDSTGQIPAQGVTRLLAVGGILGWVQSVPNGPTQLGFYTTDQIPASVVPDSRSGANYTSDRTTVSWLTNSGNQHTYWTWTPGAPNPVSKRLSWNEQQPGIVGSYLTAATPKNALLDTSTGATVDLPATTRLVGVYGNDAVLTTTGATGTTAISRVALSDLGIAGC
jgi:hypothetical protein